MWLSESIEFQRRPNHRFKLRSVHIESQRNSNFVLIDEWSICLNEMQNAVIFTFRIRDISCRRVVTIEPTNPMRNFLFIWVPLLRILIDMDDVDSYRSRCWFRCSFVVYWCVRSFIIGDGPTSGFRIDVPCKASRRHVAGHITNGVMHQHIHVCRRINWCTSLHQHPARKRLVRTRHVPSQRRISDTIAKRLINIKYRRYVREMKKVLWSRERSRSTELKISMDVFIYQV